MDQKGPQHRARHVKISMTSSSQKTAPDTHNLGRKGRERRRLILEAAKQRIIEKGLDGLVLREIAEELSITHGNLQYYFQTKDDLLLAIYDEEAQIYTTTMREFLDNATTPEGGLAAIIDSSIDVIERNETRLWRAMFRIAQQFPDLAEVLKRENEYYEEFVATELQKIAPHINPMRRYYVAKIIRAIIDGTAIGLIYDDPRSPKIAAMKNEMKAMLSVYLGLREPPSEAQSQGLNQPAGDKPASRAPASAKTAKATKKTASKKRQVRK